MNTWHESLASCSAPQENQYTTETLFPSPEPPGSDENGDPDHDSDNDNDNDDGNNSEGGGGREGDFSAYDREEYYHEGGYNDNRGDGYDHSRGPSVGGYGGRGERAPAGYGSRAQHHQQQLHGQRYHNYHDDPY